jgi:hypothetical protein
MFLKEFWSKVQSAEARGLKPNMEDYQHQKRGEEVIGVVSDSFLLAIIAVYDNALAEFVLEYPVQPTNAVRMIAALAAEMELEAAGDLARFEIRRAFRMGPDDPVILRQGYGGPVVVKAAEGVKPDGLTTAAIAEVRTAREEALKDSLGRTLENILSAPNCENPLCPFCGTDAKLAKIDAALSATLAKLAEMDRVGIN